MRIAENHTGEYLVFEPTPVTNKNLLLLLSITIVNNAENNENCINREKNDEVITTQIDTDTEEASYPEDILPSLFKTIVTNIKT